MSDISPRSLLLLASLVAIPASAQIIHTFAGTGVAGFAGDGGSAANAQLNNPHGIVADPAGNLYFADSVNARVRRIDRTTSRITTVAGNGNSGYSGDGGPATSAQLGFPSSLALDAMGNLYICDAGGTVRKVTASTGIITTVAGGGASSAENVPAGQAQLNSPFGLAVATNGDVYVSDSNNQRVRRVDHATGLIRTIAGTGSFGPPNDGGPATRASLDTPTGLALDSTGDLYIAELFAGRVRRVNLQTGIISTYVGAQSTSALGDGGPATQARLAAPTEITFDSLNNLYIADGSNERVRRVRRATGVITTVAGSGPLGTGIGSFSGDGGPATQATINGPSGLAFISGRGLFISDQNSARIRQVDISEYNDWQGAPVPDDFNTSTLNVGLWKFIDPVGNSTYSTNGSQLILSVPGGSNHDPGLGGTDNSARLMQAIADLDFQVETKFDSIPSQKYQFEGLIVEQDDANYLRLQIGSTGQAVDISVNTILGHVQTPLFVSNLTIPAGRTSLWLRLRRAGNTWTLGWSSDGATFQTAGSFVQSLSVFRLGPFVGNYNAGSAPAFTAKVDYFRNSASNVVIDEENVTVNATDNIYASGHAAIPGDGTFPRSVRFAAAPNQVLEFSAVTGTWYETNLTPNPPEGTSNGCAPNTCIQVNGANGLSSYTATDFDNALVGVFLDDSEPAGTPPAGLRFYQANSSASGIKTNFASLSPAIGQIFFIGDGRTGSGSGPTQTFRVPPTATRLFLGQADACNFNGPPGCYFDNGGSIQVTFTIRKP